MAKTPNPVILHEPCWKCGEVVPWKRDSRGRAYLNRCPKCNGIMTDTEDGTAARIAAADVAPSEPDRKEPVYVSEETNTDDKQTNPNDGPGPDAERRNPFVFWRS